MKKSLFFYLFAFILFVINQGQIKAQYGKVEQLTFFGSRVSSPVEMDVQQNGGNIVFNVICKSYFPYEFRIVFQQLSNLTPHIAERELLLHKGTNKIATFRIEDNNQSPDFLYSFEYSMGSRDLSVDRLFPYMIPIGKSNTVSLQSKNENGKTIYFINHFQMNQNDTVFCIRKGIVTALPDNRRDIDRIAATSLEILHNDGTVAVYEGIDPQTTSLDPGQTVYPGQPLGLVGDSEVMALTLYSFQGNGRLQSLNIFYADEKERLISSEKVSKKRLGYPASFIRRELTKKELKKFENNTLY